MFVIHDSNNYNRSFSQLAKESNFTFNLYRGRVDWKRLEVVDVDRIVRDQDVELLDIHMASVTNCNLDSEYDLKILDPNFIKLFRLAQLLIDFLVHCKKYLEHCIKVAHDSLQASNKEVKMLQNQLQVRKSEVKQLKKKIKEVKHQLLHSQRTSNSAFECSLCGKIFTTENYLHGHHTRRHHSSFCLGLKPQAVQLTPPIKTSIQDINEKINKPEDIINIKKRSQEEIEELKNLFFGEIEKLKQSETLNKKTENFNSSQFTSNVNLSSTKVAAKLVESGSVEVEVNPTPQPTETSVPELRQSETDTVQCMDLPVLCIGGEEEWLRRLEEREGVWRSRLSALDMQHKKQVQQLQDRLTSSQHEGQEMKKDLERRLEEVLNKFEQSQTLIKTSQMHSKDDPVKNNDKNIYQSNLASSQTDLEIQPVELIEEKGTKRQSPFQRRKAFVTQKSKTIQDQDVVEAPHEENLVEILQPHVECEIDHVSFKTQIDQKEKIGISEDREQQISKQISVVDQSKTQEEIIQSKNKETVIDKPLKEEKHKSYFNKPSDNIQSLIEEDESNTITETSTDTETEMESSENKNEQEQHKRESADQQISDKQLLQTESLLAKQSLQSMESLLSANPKILQQLRQELQQLLSRRLQGLGVDPGWSGLPPSTFSTKMTTLSHQRQITAKNHKVYYTLRDSLSQDADKAVRSRSAGLQSTKDSLLSRLRRKAALVINATTFARHGGTLIKADDAAKQSITQFSQHQPLASSSPNMSSSPRMTSIPKRPSSTWKNSSPLIASTYPPQRVSTSSQNTDASVTPKIQPTPADNSLSLSSSSYEEEEEKDRQTNNQVSTHLKPTATSVTGSYKSALRNAVSTGNLAKKKVLFVDEAIKDDTKFPSESSVAVGGRPAAPRSESVADLVQEIQQQLSQRAGRPANSVDLLRRPDALELPLSQILPLSRSGRELLQFPQVLETPPSRNVLSPPHSISSFGSSQPDSPRSNLDWALQDLEDNLRE